MTNVSVSSSTDRKSYSRLVSVDGRTYPLKSASLNARAEGGLAFTTLNQAYENPYAEALEVLYTMPLPADGAVTGYTVRMGKRVIRGEVRKRDEAREEYRKALVEGRTAALLEQERADTFSQRLGSLPPGETATIQIEVLQPLAFLSGTVDEQACWEYRFPTVVGVRYEGEKDRVPDARKLDVDRSVEEIPVRLEVSIQIADGPADDIRPYVPGHEIRIRQDENNTTVLFEGGTRLDGDVVIRWAAAKQGTGLRVIEGKGLPCDNGRYVLITLTPPNTASNAIARDLTLLIDSSGSMRGKPLDQAKTVAGEMLCSLDPGDRFEILAFSNDVRRLISGPIDASEKNIDDALKGIQKLEASGGTEMAKALTEALQPFRPGSQRQVILLSDGYIGFEKEVVREICRRLVPGARVHVVGVGSAPNRTLTRGAARAGCGIEIIIGLGENARAAASRLLKATVHPVLTDILIKGPGLISYAPRKPLDVFAGQPALIFAEIRPEGGRLEISGEMAGISAPWAHALDIPATDQAFNGKGFRITSIPIGALFGREAIEDAEINLTVAGEQSKTTEKKIESLGLRHGIASRMTSLIAISEGTTVDPTNPRRFERMPVEIPAGVSAEGTGLMPAAAVLLGGWGAAHSLGDARPLQRREGIVEAKPPWERTGQIFGKIMSSRKKRELEMSAVSPIVIKAARVLKVNDQVLAFEFEVPFDGFVLAEQNTKVRVVFDNGDEKSAEVLESDSSKPGPHQAGLIIRLALKLEGRGRWREGVARIEWKDLRGPSPRKTKVVVEICVALRAKDPKDRPSAWTESD